MSTNVNSADQLEAVVWEQRAALMASSSDNNGAESSTPLPSQSSSSGSSGSANPPTTSTVTLRSRPGDVRDMRLKQQSAPVPSSVTGGPDWDSEEGGNPQIATAETLLGAETGGAGAPSMTIINVPGDSAEDGTYSKSGTLQGWYQGHSFVKKVFHKPATCHHCIEMLWGLLGTTGVVCEICNFLAHERCVKLIVAPCACIMPFLVQDPTAHCWSEPGHFKRKFCNVCRKRVDEMPAVRCEICEYYAHLDCLDFVVSDCKMCATWTPNEANASQAQAHHWREGNLPINSKCCVCKKTCWSSECLTGMRCEWCGATGHYSCYQSISPECNFGILRDIILPPTAVSLPRTSILMEHIIGMQRPVQDPLAAVQAFAEDLSSSGDSREESGYDKDKGKSVKDKGDKELDEFVRVYDGMSRYRKRQCRYLSLGKSVTVRTVVEVSLKAFQLPPDEAKDYYIVEVNEKDGGERRLDDTTSFKRHLHFESRRPQIILRCKDRESTRDYINVYPGVLTEHAEVTVRSMQVPITRETTAHDALVLSLRRFGVEHLDANKYHLVETSLDRGMTESVLTPDERPWDILDRLKRESIRALRLTRFYIYSVDDPHGPSVALFVGNLKKGLSQRLYERILMEKMGVENKWSSIEVIYHDFGTLVLLYTNAEKADRAYNILRNATFEDRPILVMILPLMQPERIPDTVQPLLIFVNVKSGGCQGTELISSFRKLVNPHQVFNLEYGGPLAGLHCFKGVQKFKILVCGGDGTVGWALSCLDNVGQDACCPTPPMAIVPLGTGNDLARVLRWGPGYTGGQDPLSLLRDVVEAEEIRLDRWTVVIKPDQVEMDEGKRILQIQAASADITEDTSRIFVMNNYFGIGIDADLNLDFHMAREENPAKFNSRIHNKGVYFKMGLRKMVNRTKCKDLHQQIILEVDGRVIDLPPLEGIIILNILSWGAGANPWGVEKEDYFSKPNHYDGMLEVVGVTGVVHMGQIFSGLRTGTRIAQGGHVRIVLKTDIPVQVDGEPWIQSPGQIIVLRSALKATMLKKRKKHKVNRRNTEPGIAGPGGVNSPSSAAATSPLVEPSSCSGTGAGASPPAFPSPCTPPRAAAGGPSASWSPQLSGSGGGGGSKGGSFSPLANPPLTGWKETGPRTGQENKDEDDSWEDEGQAIPESSS